MQSHLEPSRNALTFLASHIDKLCSPNPKYTPIHAEQVIGKSRNKMVLVIHVICFFLYLSDYFFRGAPLADCIFRSLLCIIVIIAVFLSCRYHPQILRILYALICISYGPGVIDASEEGIHAAWVMAPLLPMFQFLFTGSYWHTTLQALIQLIFLNTIYCHKMQQAVRDMSPDAFTLALKQNFILIFVVNGIIVYLMHYFMNQAYQRALKSENKKIESEKQKVFLLGFSHELRNVINSLAGNVKLTSLEKNLPVKARELLLNAEICGELLIHLINNILDTGKVELGELEINPIPTKIYDAVEKVWSVCSELIKRKELKGSIRIPRDLPRTLIVDPYRLTQMFLNLVSNATKYTDRGFVNIGIEWIDTCSEVNEECFKPYPFNDDDDQDEGIFEKDQGFSIFNDNYLHLDTNNKKISPLLLKPPKELKRGVLKVTITDTGCGVSKEESRRLFQKFTQVPDDTSRRRLGTGLGLFINRQICEKLGGEIRVFSKQDCGSCFIFCIPLDVAEDQSRAHIDTESLKELIRAKNLKAMIVDDVPFNHVILRNFFEKLGIAVVDVAVNGSEAYEKYSALSRINKTPEIITMDIEMPVMNGKDASHMIRELEGREGLEPCFMAIVSGNCTDSEIRECLDKHGRVKADSFIKKPATIEDILGVIGNHFIDK